MEFSVNNAFNASAEIADSARYPGIRLATAARAVADAPQLDQVQEGLLSGSRSLSGRV